MITSDTINKKFSFFLFLLTALNLAFLGLYLVLSYHNRFSFEEFYFIETYKREGGFFEAINFYYQNWMGRWMAFAYFYLWFGSVTTTTTLKVCIFFYHLFTLNILLWSVYRTMKASSNKLFNPEVPNLLIFNFALLFCSALFFFSFQIIENWWWLCSTFFHLQSVVFLSLTISVLVNKKSYWFNYFLLVVSGLYIGASSEVMAVLILVLTPILIIYFQGWSKAQIRAFFFSVAGKKIIVLFLMVLISLCSNVFSPGVMSRQQVLEGLSAMPKAENKELFRFYDSWGKPAIYIFLRPQYILFFLLMTVVFFASNSFLKNGINSDRLLKCKKGITRLTFILILIPLVIAAFVNIYAFKSNLGPLRSWIPTSFIWVIIFFSFMIYMGVKIDLSENFKRIGLFLNVFIAMIIMGIYLQRQYRMTSLYANTYDNRWKALRENKLSNEEIDILYPPVSSGMLVDTHIDKEKFKQIDFFQSNKSDSQP